MLEVATRERSLRRVGDRASIWDGVLVQEKSRNGGEVYQVEATLSESTQTTCQPDMTSKGMQRYVPLLSFFVVSCFWSR